MTPVLTQARSGIGGAFSPQLGEEFLIITIPMILAMKKTPIEDKKSHIPMRIAMGLGGDGNASPSSNLDCKDSSANSFSGQKI
ncbi:hypothetical protein OAP46_00490 [bacterium]|nr:hypothetical protein [bacterium]